MRLFIDCEYDGYKGDLLTMALVSEELDGLYFVRDDIQAKDPWVQENVVPFIFAHEDNDQTSMYVGSYEFLQGELEKILSYFQTVTIVADWPEDVAHFCNFLITGPGERINTPPLAFSVRRDLDGVNSAVPHNALEDARSIARLHRRLKKQADNFQRGLEPKQSSSKKHYFETKETDNG